MIIMELQILFGDIYLGKTILLMIYLFLENPRINCQMDACEFEGLIYNTLSEEPLANHKFDMKDEKNDYTQPDYVSHNLGIIFGETWTCLTCHAKKLKVLNYDSFIFPLVGISQK